MTSFEPIRSVERTMRVLLVLNRNPITRIGDLVAKTGLPAPTLVRILETLSSLGYVRKQGRTTGYTLTEKVRELSAGYHGLPQLLDRMKPVLKELTQRILWPAALATLEEDAMVVRLSTIPESPLSHTHSTLQKRLDLLTRAHGRAYLAFCPDQERRRLINLLCEMEISRMPAEKLNEHMLPVFTRVRRTGFAERDHAIDPQTTTIAMPVMKSREVVATLGITFFKGAKPNRRMLIRELSRAVERCAQIIAEQGKSG